MATPVEQELRKAVTDLDALRVRWALVGGLAISVRSVPRFTKDLDFAVAVANDSEAEDAPVATTGHLIALKTLAGRNQDLTDLGSLIPSASAEDLEIARQAVRLIHERGFNREQDIVADLGKLIAELGR